VDLNAAQAARKKRLELGDDLRRRFLALGDKDRPPHLPEPIRIVKPRFHEARLMT
jgi:hypothetical protein